MMKLLTAKADNFAYIGRIPITAAATSISRIAIHSRPMAPRTRFLASNAKITRKPRQNKYLSNGVSIFQPNNSKFDTDTEPEAVLLVNHFTRKNAQSQKNCAAKVAIAKYNPRTRKLGTPNNMPTSVAKKPPISSAAITGMPSMRT